ncbi:hypothetical protein ACFLZQ_01305 [Thermodesulfobacteriota bacterium]
MSAKDIAKANKKLLAFYEKTDTGPHFTTERIRKIEAQTAKADPQKSVECALQDARSSLTQCVNKNAA